MVPRIKTFKSWFQLLQTCKTLTLVGIMLFICACSIAGDPSTADVIGSIACPIRAILETRAFFEVSPDTWSKVTNNSQG